MVNFPSVSLLSEQPDMFWKINFTAPLSAPVGM